MNSTASAASGAVRQVLKIKSPSLKQLKGMGYTKVFNLGSLARARAILGDSGVE